MKSLASPKEAVERLIGEPFSEWLMAFITFQIQEWPEMAVIKTSKPEIGKIKKFLLQLFLVDSAFIGGQEGDPGFLRFAIANLSESDDPLAESALIILEKRRQEELAGHKVERGQIITQSRALWSRLFKALGLDEPSLDHAETKEHTRNYIAEVSDILSNAEWQTAVGAFTVFERATPEEYKAVIQLLKANTQVSDHDLEALTKRVSMYDQYAKEGSHMLEKVVFDDESKRLVWVGVRKHLDLRHEFYTAITRYLES